jgi:hypothetical protein
MWKKIVGIAAITLAATIGPGMLSVAAQDAAPCTAPGPDQGNFDQQGDWQGQNVMPVPCGS